LNKLELWLTVKPAIFGDVQLRETTTKLYLIHTVQMSVLYSLMFIDSMTISEDTPSTAAHQPVKK
jgi:hypothetical protein